MGVFTMLNMSGALAGSQFPSQTMHLIKLRKFSPLAGLLLLEMQ